MRAAIHQVTSWRAGFAVSIRAAHAGSDTVGHRSCTSADVSIRAAHAGSDLIAKFLRDTLEVSIRAAHAGSDWSGAARWRVDQCFNPRCPCGQRLDPLTRATSHYQVSIRAAHAGSDKRDALLASIAFVVSIRAAHAGSDERNWRPS